MMMKRDKDRFFARYEQLDLLCKRIIDDPHSIDGDTKAELQAATMKYASTLNPDDPTQVLEMLYCDENGLGRSVRKAVEVIGEADGGDDIAKRDRGSGHHDLAASLVRHLTEALERRREAHGYTKAAKEQPMDSLENILKDYGPIKLCKHIVETQHAPCDEHALVAALTKSASEMYPDLSEAQAFAKLYEDASVWQAIAIAKAMPFQVSLEPLVVTGVAATHEAVDNTESSEAYQQLKELGAQKWPTASEAQQFANAFSDPKNAALAQKAHRRPAATTVFPMPQR
jgi:hypothetical protein